MPLHTILVIDDDSLVRWSLAQDLSRNGYRVVDACCAAEARARVADEPGLRLILLDLKLLDMDGLALLAVLRRDGCTCPVIVLSAHLTPELSLKALAAGASFVAEKPFQLDGLRALVQRAIESPQSLPN